MWILLSLHLMIWIYPKHTPIPKLIPMKPPSCKCTLKQVTSDCSSECEEVVIPSQEKWKNQSQNEMHARRGKLKTMHESFNKGESGYLVL